jgi:uncharacterized phage protein (TIGR01671 family)
VEREEDVSIRKMRAWDKFNGEMCEVRGINLVEGGALCSPIRPEKKAVSYRWRDINDFEFMDASGLLDKNGKEVYEGDLTTGQYKLLEIHPKKIITKVFYNTKRCQYYLIAKDKRIQMGLTKNMIINHRIEIIGNIHENPELLA